MKINANLNKIQQSRLLANDKCDNEMRLGAVRRSPSIYITDE